MKSAKFIACSIFSLLLLLSVDSSSLAKSVKSGTKIAWGGVGRFGMGGFGYGRLIRLGTRSLYRGRRRGYGSRRRRGQFSYNHNRINNYGMQNGYLRGASGGAYGGNPAGNSALWGRAQGRFDRRHTNNELWNRGTMLNANQGSGFRANPGQSGQW